MDTHLPGRQIVNTPLPTLAGAETSSKVSVLVVDSSASVRESIREAVTLEPGLKVVDAASTAKTAFQSFLQHRPDVVIAEVCLPDYSGLELLWSMRQANSRCLLILVSRMPDPFVAEVGRLLGADEICAKTDDLETLRTVLRRSVGVRLTANAAALSSS